MTNVNLAFGNVSDASLEVTIDNPVDVAGFQFDITGADLGAASGGLAVAAGFTVSTGGSTVLGFSFSGAVIPAESSGVLTNLEYTANESEACLANPVISDSNGEAVDVSLGELSLIHI